MSLSCDIASFLGKFTLRVDGANRRKPLLSKFLHAPLYSEPIPRVSYINHDLGSWPIVCKSVSDALIEYFPAY